MFSHYKCNWVKCVCVCVCVCVCFFYKNEMKITKKFMKSNKLQKIKIKTNIVLNLLLEIFQEIENS